MADHITVDPKALCEGERPIMNATYGKLMMWFFLISDAFTFTGLLVAYGALRFRSGQQGVAWANPEEVFTHTPGLYEWFHIEWPLVFVGIMTLILILSSVTMVLAVEAGHRKSKDEVAKWMLWTVLGGLTFVICQGYEWYHFIIGHHDGAFTLGASVLSKFTEYGMELKDQVALLVVEPGVMALKNYSGEILTNVEGVKAIASTEFIDAYNAAMAVAKESGHKLDADAIVALANTNGAPVIAELLVGAEFTSGGANMLVNEYGPPAFADLFFFVTGFHGTHVFSGVIINFIIYLNVVKGTYEERGHYEMVEKVGLYWHFVDLVWVFVFTFFYLV